MGIWYVDMATGNGLWAVIEDSEWVDEVDGIERLVRAYDDVSSSSSCCSTGCVSTSSFFIFFDCVLRQASAYALQAASLRIYCDGDRLNNCCIRLTFLETNCLEHPLMRASSVSVGGSPMPNAMSMHRAWNSTSGISDSCIAITTRRMMDSTSSWSYMRFGSGGGSS